MSAVSLSKRPPAPKSTPSGQHPAVVAYRRKLDSVADTAGAELDSLDQAIQKYLEEVKSDPPPKI